MAAARPHGANQVQRFDQLEAHLDVWIENTYTRICCLWAFVLGQERLTRSIDDIAICSQNPGRNPVATTQHVHICSHNTACAHL